jgi:hypothetical protein
MTRTPRAFAKAQRFLRIIDAMTDAERKYPSTLIDRMAEERIAQDAGVASEDVKRIVQVFTSLTVRPDRPAEKPKTLDDSPAGLALRDGPKASDLHALPERACVAFAVRCALRANLGVRSLDDDTNAALRRAIDMAEEYAGGKDLDPAWHETSAMLQHAATLLRLESAPSIEQNAVDAAEWSFAVARAVGKSKSPPWDTLLAHFTAAAATAAITVRSENLAEVGRSQSAEVGSRSRRNWCRDAGCSIVLPAASTSLTASIWPP